MIYYFYSNPQNHMSWLWIFFSLKIIKDLPIIIKLRQCSISNVQCIWPFEQLPSSSPFIIWLWIKLNLSTIDCSCHIWFYLWLLISQNIPIISWSFSSILKVITSSSLLIIISFATCLHHMTKCFSHVHFWSLLQGSGNVLLWAAKNSIEKYS